MQDLELFFVHLRAPCFLLPGALRFFTGVVQLFLKSQNQGALFVFPLHKIGLGIAKKEKETGDKTYLTTTSELIFQLPDERIGQFELTRMRFDILDLALKADDVALHRRDVGLALAGYPLAAWGMSSVFTNWSGCWRFWIAVTWGNDGMRSKGTIEGRAGKCHRSIGRLRGGGDVNWENGVGRE